MTIVKLEIERYVQQIVQLIKTEISQDAPDLKLIEKCNNVDVPKVSKAITSCGDALEKYVVYLTWTVNTLIIFQQFLSEQVIGA